MSSSLVSFSIEIFSSELSSPVSTSKVSPSLASSSTRCDCSVFFSRSVICDSVATRATIRCPSSPAISSSTISCDGSLTAITSRVFMLLERHKVVAEHQLHRHRAQQLVLNLEVLQVHKLRVIAARQRLGLRALVLLAAPPAME